MIERDDILPEDITSNNVAILITWVINDDDNVYPQNFSEEALTAKNWWEFGKS